MRRLLLIILLCVSQVAWAGDFEDGVAAFNRQDYNTALERFRSAAQRGSASAQFNLGSMYDNGQGVVQNYKEAVRWYTLAAQQGHEKAQQNLGVMFGSGRGVLQDYIRAYMWFNIAALSGDRNSVKGRDVVAGAMTPQQIEQAQRMARECINSNFKKCD